MARIGISLAAFALYFAVAPAGAAVAQDAQGVVMKACTACHNPKRICAKLGVKDGAAWEATVSAMMKKGAKVTTDDKPAVVEWLASQKAGAKPVCD